MRLQLMNSRCPTHASRTAPEPPRSFTMLLQSMPARLDGGLNRPARFGRPSLEPREPKPQGRRHGEGHLPLACRDRPAVLAVEVADFDSAIPATCVDQCWEERCVRGSSTDPPDGPQPTWPICRTHRDAEDCRCRRTFGGRRRSVHQRSHVRSFHRNVACRQANRP